MSRAEEAQVRDGRIKLLMNKADEFILILAGLLWQQKKKNNYRLVMGTETATWKDYCNWELKRNQDYCSQLVRIYATLIKRLNIKERDLVGISQTKLAKITQYAVNRINESSEIVARAEVKDLAIRSRHYSRSDFNNLVEQVTKGKTIKEIEDCEHRRKTGEDAFEEYKYRVCSLCGQRESLGG